jgi:superfamily I DNA/RNA helicase
MAFIYLPKKMADSSWRVVLGPPGCGKTTCLLKMLRAELEAGTSPRSIAFVSFTRAARLEVLQRVGRDFEFGKDDMPWLRTIHSTAYKLLGLSRGQIMTRKAWREFAGMYGYDLTDPKDIEVELANGVMEPPRRTEDDVLLYTYEWGRNRRLDVERSMGKCPAYVSALPGVREAPG